MDLVPECVADRASGAGDPKLTFDQVAIDKATAHSAESADVILRKPAALRRVAAVLADLLAGRPAVAR